MFQLEFFSMNKTTKAKNNWIFFGFGFFVTSRVVPKNRTKQKTKRTNKTFLYGPGSKGNGVKMHTHNTLLNPCSVSIDDDDGYLLQQQKKSYKC